MSFDIREILEMAREMERNGVAFYTKAVQFVKDDKMKAMLKEMAGWEAEHEKYFAGLQESMQADNGLFDPDNEAAQYLFTLVDPVVFGKKSPKDHFSEGTNEVEILNIAIGLEKDSISYYTGIRELVTSSDAKAKVDSIIKEEMRHVTILTDRLREVTK